MVNSLQLIKGIVYLLKNLFWRKTEREERRKDREGEREII